MYEHEQGIPMKTGNNRLLRVSALAGAMGVLLLAGCQRGEEAAPAPDASPAAEAAATEPTPATEAPLDLRDVVENNEREVVGISYPAGIDRYPGLARALQDYATTARGDLQQALDGLGNDKPTMPYELSLSFEKVLETPQLVVVSADGSRYTGGAHGEPLVARFVWLPPQQQMLSASTLVADDKGWKAISDFVADQLRERVATRLSSEDMQPADLQESLRNASRMIAEGTGPQAENFSQFQPLTDDKGQITALRFVFPPYQVGPYSDGTQTADVPAAVLLPHVAKDYVALFARG
ncbi:hypothetical protein DCO49_17990 [Stenotrophomonas sp. SPM]|uniref:DUF3298 and DUF4163 domain-containing protein n=1 Tax=Stenotrophomonas sp. SPM TaxID=2170735 RepID=UPI000DE750C6|nr:DUF3298 and DUF4163 domain-containing protein [Stenotrophomonas sp. SPM]PWB20760.1 hypothetical protein DCO49_17990 [Stenotrophomonas sp. SPM]